MKTLVAYYSRTGVTRSVAEELARLLGASLEPIREERDRSGVLGFLASGKEAILRRRPPVAAAACDPGLFDLVVVGTPVWAGTMASPVRTWLGEYAGKIGRFACFCTTASSSRDKTLAAMAAIAGQEPVARLGLLEKAVRAGAFRAELAGFVEKLKQG